MCGGQVKGTSDRVRSGPSEALQGEIVSTITDGWCRPIAHRGFGDPRRRVAANLCGTLRHDQVNVGHINSLPVEKRIHFPLLGTASQPSAQRRMHGAHRACVGLGAQCGSAARWVPSANARPSAHSRRTLPGRPSWHEARRYCRPEGTPSGQRGLWAYVPSRTGVWSLSSGLRWPGGAG